MCGLLGAKKPKPDSSGYMSKHQTMYKSPTWCAPPSVPNDIHVVPMRADSPAFPHQKPIRVLQMSGALVLHRLFAERPERDEDGEKRGVGLGYINPSLDCTSCFTYSTHLVVLLPKYPWSAFMECGSAPSFKIGEKIPHGVLACSVRLLDQK